MRGFVGILMEVGSSIFGLFIIRFEMQLLPLSLGRTSGKLRFLKGWLFSRGQQLMVKFLPWITLYFVVTLWLKRRCMCCCNAESMDHLLLFCSVAHSSWMYMLWLFGIDWVMPGLVVDLLFCWYHWLGKYSSDI